ncbi:MAG TPA: folylpolyglutamate synthase/dihydrofolate synthase family protein [Chryseosolibacter sp.]|nr:folylpolyglutamate synthase/dihydrofolate synthase family protein [Chryseosolibacter sp.]
MISTYEEVLEYLYKNLPIFQRVGAAAYKKDINNTVALCNALGNPQHKFRSVHVAGTNGKGSSSHMIASVMQSAGYRTGLYTSPHLKSFTERIRIDGEDVSKAFVVDFVKRVQPLIAQIQPSFFEITVAMAFEYFALKEVDIAVIEVGLGGRLDSTNVITPEVSLITNIGWDHNDLLGDTLEKIAGEKAGIIKPGIPVVISERQPGVENVFIAKASECNAPITFASDHYSVLPVNDGQMQVSDLSGRAFEMQLPLQGQYQRKNIFGVLKVIDILNARGYGITRAQLLHGLENVVKQTGLKGRWQVLSRAPLTICDTGHNIDGVKEILSQLATLSFQRLHIIWGMVKDKDVSDILAILPRDANYYFCQANIPRAMDATALLEKSRHYNLQGIAITDVNEALALARENAKTDDVIFVGGSTFVVAELNEL